MFFSITDKLKNRKRDGTPDKSGTPSQDAMPDESATSARNVIWNEEIERLQIKDEELQKVKFTVYNMSSNITNPVLSLKKS